jgi:hypothetical protein
LWRSFATCVSRVVEEVSCVWTDTFLDYPEHGSSRLLQTVGKKLAVNMALIPEVYNIL